MADKPTDKRQAYARVGAEISAVLAGEDNLTARMATVCGLLSQSFDDFFWTGFYIVDPARKDELVVGPYQGTLGCLRIPFGKGVCGTAAARQETVIVDDVDSFPGHIACDARSRSEIVVPVFDPDGRLFAVLDVDSERVGAFDEEDKSSLEALMLAVFAAG